MLQQINKQLEKWMPFITPTSVATGMLLSAWLSPFRDWVPWIFAFMTFSGSLSMNFGDLRRVLSQPLPILVFLFVLHAVMPFAAWSFGHLAFPGDPLTVTGLVLLLSIPTGVVSFVWVSMYAGHIALTLSMILIDTLLSPFVVPYTLSVLVGAQVELDVWGMMQGLAWMVVLPSLIGMALNHLTGGRAKTGLGPKLAPFSKVGLAAVVAINSSVIAPYFANVTGRVVWLVAVCLAVVATGYLLGWAAAKALGWSRETAIAMTFNCGMRNISAGAVLAISHFPPPVTLPTMIGMVFQQMMASLFAHLLFGRITRGSGAKPSGTVRRSSGART